MPGVRPLGSLPGRRSAAGDGGRWMSSGGGTFAGSGPCMRLEPGLGDCPRDRPELAHGQEVPRCRWWRGAVAAHRPAGPRAGDRRVHARGGRVAARCWPPASGPPAAAPASSRKRRGTACPADTPGPSPQQTRPPSLPVSRRRPGGGPGPLQDLLTRAPAAQVTVEACPLSVYDQIAQASPFTNRPHLKDVPK